MFELKKIIGSLLMPLPMSLIIIFLLLLLTSKANKKSYLACLSTVLTLWMISTPFFANFIITPKEQTQKTFSVKAHSQIDAIVVLGSGVHPNTKLTANQQLSSTGIARLIEGIRLARIYPNAELIVSGAGLSNVTSSELMAQAALSIGISSHRIRQNPQAYDTAQEAKLLAPRLVDSKVILVTSASHMHRAQDLFSAQGIDTYPSPVEVFSYHNTPTYLKFIASSSVLNAITTYTHEWIGQKWITLRRALDSEAL
ncbi:MULTISPECIES: YdcF family protein [Pseudoalteromonas]|uniref:DUF218 domain-containing protein n=1 Tax=Pseudoalteromonas luteoviolacea (strain 2ta16) TaxID=1353533 RepID=V4H2F7_PSEL2|nr:MULTISPECIES: YdcF family protein [Pseudoalteromonas]ESP91651.1 hypothetical protein PL2TA16_00098 [Pseudoalteromonas luteoviolacea 2ta16]KZN35860.1 hypothetical protein N483_23535 [Pseudoalteromonas luteoviolacea NCIMB 1944]MCG7551461.1 YdcF family protein [Pseudoalteromonas sp. Of7M-16]